MADTPATPQPKPISLEQKRNISWLLIGYMHDKNMHDKKIGVPPTFKNFTDADFNDFNAIDPEGTVVITKFDEQGKALIKRDSKGAPLLNKNGEPEKDTYAVSAKEWGYALAIDRASDDYDALGAAQKAFVDKALGPHDKVTPETKRKMLYYLDIADGAILAAPTAPSETGKTVTATPSASDKTATSTNNKTKAPVIKATTPATPKTPVPANGKTSASPNVEPTKGGTSFVAPSNNDQYFASLIEPPVAKAREEQALPTIGLTPENMDKIREVSQGWQDPNLWKQLDRPAQENEKSLKDILSKKTSPEGGIL